MPNSSSHEDRCIGCLLATACGDILGAAVEGQPADSIRGRHGEVRDFLDTFRGFGCYTDDTEMTLALATSLVEKGTADPEDMSLKYAEFYESRRGYGATAHRVMGALLNGADYRTTGRIEFPNGSFGNGGAMRISPVGLAYRHASDEVLHQTVESALLCTHVHPEAIDGAFVQAKAVSILATSDAVAASLWAFLRYGDNPEECLIRAVNFGGDTDTIGAMVGAQLGSLYGSEWIPNRWFSQIENRRHGRDFMVDLAKRLAQLDIRR